MAFRVELSRRAEQDLRTIVGWLSSLSITGAKTWLDRWDELLIDLESKADTCSPAPESSEDRETLFQEIFKTRKGKKYRVLFVMRNDQVLITNIRGPGQDLLEPEDVGWN